MSAEAVGSKHSKDIGRTETFTFESTGQTTAVDTGRGFHFSFTDVDFYTVDFDDPALRHVDSASDRDNPFQRHTR